jgi:hypothetical protein
VRVCDSKPVPVCAGVWMHTSTMSKSMKTVWMLLHAKSRIIIANTDSERAMSCHITLHD